ncbi:MAG: hypothetical protein ABW004_12625 [Aeromicrobium sp.]
MVLWGGGGWGYELAPRAAGTHVSETWDISDDRQRFFLKRTKMPAAAKNGMRKTLDRLAETLEGSP